MRTHFKILTALLTVWVAVIGLLTLAPEAAGTWPRSASDVAVSARDPGAIRPAPAFSHTGLWVAEVGHDGTVAFVRDIRRR